MAASRRAERREKGCVQREGQFVSGGEALYRVCRCHSGLAVQAGASSRKTATQPTAGMHCRCESLRESAVRYTCTLPAQPFSALLCSLPASHPSSDPFKCGVQHSRAAQRTGKVSRGTGLTTRGGRPEQKARLHEHAAFRPREPLSSAQRLQTATEARSS